MRGPRVTGVNSPSFAHQRPSHERCVCRALESQARSSHKIAVRSNRIAIFTLAPELLVVDPFPYVMTVSTAPLLRYSSLF